jgi:pre-rRNA-processing protein TSR4
MDPVEPAAAADDLEEENVVRLGYLEPLEAGPLPQHPLGTSFVGGKPHWLQPELPPPPAVIACGTCTAPMAFLLQLYAPTDEETSFHRTLYVFCCKTPSCHQSSSSCFRVLRCHLARKNAFWPFDLAGLEHVPQEQLSRRAPTCRVCGAGGPKLCGRCRRPHYCSRLHQALDWKGGHSDECPLPAPPLHLGLCRAAQVWCFPAFSLLDEPEPPAEEDSADPAVLEGQERQRYEALAPFLKEHEDGKPEEYQSTKDKSLRLFHKTVARMPQQVLRYYPSGVAAPPVLLSPEQPPLPPPCPACHAARRLELQIMPQLLYYLKPENVATGASLETASIDWGTLLIYTCSKDCGAEGAYMPEHLWRQDWSTSSKGVPLEDDGSDEDDDG